MHLKNIYNKLILCLLLLFFKPEFRMINLNKTIVQFLSIHFENPHRALKYTEVAIISNVHRNWIATNATVKLQNQQTANTNGRHSCRGRPSDRRGILRGHVFIKHHVKTLKRTRPDPRDPVQELDQSIPGHKNADDTRWFTFSSKSPNPRPNKPLPSKTAIC